MTYVASIIHQIAKAVVSDPSQVKVKEIKDDRMRVIVVSCDEKDIGRVVGREGRLARAIRTIAYHLGARLGVKYRVEFQEVSNHGASA